MSGPLCAHLFEINMQNYESNNIIKNKLYNPYKSSCKSIRYTNHIIYVTDTLIFFRSSNQAENLVN